ncbi:MAG: MBL fold metallo-hydrolase [Spirochaetales bacterium]|nr:MBL fold metallo-hydrolase [Spirochaetales bacterium]
MEKAKSFNKETDYFNAGSGTLAISFLGHGSLAMELGDFVIYIDPVSDYGVFSKYPKADLILVTHEHADHLDAGVIKTLSKPATRLILSPPARTKLGAGEILHHGQKHNILLPGWNSEIEIEAVPAYNISQGRTHFHPKERRDNGYILAVGTLRIYLAGDTEDIPEMSDLGRIDIAFLPMNQPYTMLPEQTAAAALRIKPSILYPYHFGGSDTEKLVKLLEDEKSIEVRLRKMQ